MLKQIKTKKQSHSLKELEHSPKGKAGLNPESSLLLLQEKVLRLKQDVNHLSFMIQEINQVVEAQNRVKRL